MGISKDYILVGISGNSLNMALLTLNILLNWSVISKLKEENRIPIKFFIRKLEANLTTI